MYAQQEARIYNGVKTISLTSGAGKTGQLLVTACLELVHGDDPERCYGEGGGRGVHVWERM